MRQSLEFIQANSNVPEGGVFTTARRGTKWLTKVRPGEIVDLVLTEGEKFGEAVITSTTKTTLWEVLDTAQDNFQFKDLDPTSARQGLLAALKAAYGPDIEGPETFTKIGFVRLVA